ncbi:rhamnulokinase [Paenibacillus segetis]|uniref:L-fuculose kinase n=1 Tax=Paenibacillus segetis TaxID=1325360 RepID=A0ABQ1YK89_9BACL|nr:rhamnulokinase family protein [Paenibacillus segetis]GGH28453.1 L-fuculose kinase [Paenibacillus segetis]
MKQTPCVLAFDLGASSGRALIGEIVMDESGGPSQLRITEVHRFPNNAIQIGNHLHWDTPLLLQEIKNGILKAFQAGFEPESCAIDTWGVDFGLLDRNGELLGIPYHYRDHQTEGLVEEVSAFIGAERLFRESGLQFMPFNTLYQLYAMKKAGSPKLDLAETLLLTPDLFNYFLTGRKACEFSMATTTQLYDPGVGEWNTSLMEELGLPTSMFLEPVQPGTVIGELTDALCSELGVAKMKVIAVASHDTESAAAAVPASTSSYAYLVSGTWSLLGTAMTSPILDPAAMEYQFSNEGGADGTYHLLKNIMGLWIVQECKRKWEQQGTRHSFGDLVDLAEAAAPFHCLIDPDNLGFMNPDDMPEAIRSYCRETGQHVPLTVGEIIRCILESLALRYRQVLEQAEELTGSLFEGLHMVGGGIQNELLCRFTANALGRPVWTGPVEASAIGNMLVQLETCGHIGDLQDGIELVKSSFPINTYAPESQQEWSEAYARYMQIVKTPVQSKVNANNGK